MVRIGRSPPRSGMGVIGLATVLGALLLASPTAGVIDDAAWAFPVAFAGWAVRPTTGSWP
jgi:hypothetical protein